MSLKEELIRYFLRPHHLVNFKEYAQKPSLNSLEGMTFFEIKTYGEESILGAELIFNDILTERAGVELVLGFDNICLPYCTSKRRRGCVAYDGVNKIIISHKEILFADKKILKEYGLKERMYYSPKEIKGKLNID